MITSWPRKKQIATLVLIVVLFATFGLIRLSIQRANAEIARLLQLLNNVYPDDTSQIPAPDEANEEDYDPDSETPDDSPGVSKPGNTKPKSENIAQDSKTPDDNGPGSSGPPEVPPPADNQQRHAIFGYMPIADQSYLIAISNRFSLKEIRMIIDSYHSGGDAWEASKQLVRERVTEDEITRVQYLINEYVR